jgi:hypothetical protein
MNWLAKPCSSIARSEHPLGQSASSLRARRRSRASSRSICSTPPVHSLAPSSASMVGPKECYERIAARAFKQYPLIGRYGEGGRRRNFVPLLRAPTALTGEGAARRGVSSPHALTAASLATARGRSAEAGRLAAAPDAAAAAGGTAPGTGATRGTSRASPLPTPTLPPALVAAPPQPPPPMLRCLHPRHLIQRLKGRLQQQAWTPPWQPGTRRPCWTDRTASNALTGLSFLSRILLRSRKSQRARASSVPHS